MSGFQSRIGDLNINKTEPLTSQISCGWNSDRNPGRGQFGAKSPLATNTLQNRNGTSTVIKCQVSIRLTGFHHLSMTSQSWPRENSTSVARDFLHTIIPGRDDATFFVGAVFRKEILRILPPPRNQRAYDAEFWCQNV